MSDKPKVSKTFEEAAAEIAALQERFSKMMSSSQIPPDRMIRLARRAEAKVAAEIAKLIKDTTDPHVLARFFATNITSTLAVGMVAGDAMARANVLQAGIAEGIGVQAKLTKVMVGIARTLEAQRAEVMAATRRDPVGPIA